MSQRPHPDMPAAGPHPWQEDSMPPDLSPTPIERDAEAEKAKADRAALERESHDRRET